MMNIEDIEGDKVLLFQHIQSLLWKKWPEKEIQSLLMGQSLPIKFPKSPVIQHRVTKVIPDTLGMTLVLVAMQMTAEEGLLMMTQGHRYQGGTHETRILVEGSIGNVGIT